MNGSLASRLLARVRGVEEASRRSWALWLARVPVDAETVHVRVLVVGRPDRVVGAALTGRHVASGEHGVPEIAATLAIVEHQLLCWFARLLSLGLDGAREARDELEVVGVGGDAWRERGGVGGSGSRRCFFAAALN